MFSTFRNAALVSAAALCALAASPPARAGLITLDVSAIFSPGAGITCAATGCRLGGDIVIDNSTGAPNGGFVSADVTTSGFSPVVGPFTIFDRIEDTFASSPNTALSLRDVAPPAPVTDFLDLEFDTATAGSLAGYTGGPLLSGIVFLKGSLMVDASLTSGSLTPTPEPASLTLLAVGLAGLGMALRLRRA